MSNETLEKNVLDLPGQLETLSITDWYHEYAEPARLLPSPAIDNNAKNPVPQSGYEDDDDCIKRLSSLQNAVMSALSKLGPVLATQTKIKNVVFWVHKWNVPERDDVWKHWSQAPVTAVTDSASSSGNISMEAEKAMSSTRTKSSAKGKRASQKAKKTRVTTNLRKLKRE